MTTCIQVQKVRESRILRCDLLGPCVPFYVTPCDCKVQRLIAWLLCYCGRVTSRSSIAGAAAALDGWDRHRLGKCDSKLYHLSGLTNAYQRS